MKDFIGINTRVTDPLKYINKFQSIREYHKWADGVGYDTNNVANCTAGLLRFNPSQNTASLDNFDAFYGILANRLHPSYKWLAPQMRGLQTYNDDVLEQKPICLDGLPGAGNTAPSGTPYQQLEKFFTIGTILRNASREDLNLSATRHHKSYVAFDNTSTYSVSISARFPDSTNSTSRIVKAWVDSNGDGDFVDASELLFTSSVIPAGGVQLLSAAFNLPTGISASDLKRYFRLRIMACQAPLFTIPTS